MIRRDRNHPSIIMWSIGNEIPRAGKPKAGALLAKRLTDICHEEDRTRPVTSGINNAEPPSRAASPKPSISRASTTNRCFTNRS